MSKTGPPSSSWLPPAAAVRVQKARHEDRTVRVRRRNGTLVVGIAHDERLGKGKVNGHIVPSIVTDTVRRVFIDPLISFTMVPYGMVRLPAVGAGQHALWMVVPVIALPRELPRKKLGFVVLEVMDECTILQHKKDNMFDV